MTDAEFEAQKARIQALIDRWVGMLGFESWHLVFAFDRDGLEMATCDPGAPRGTLASTKASWEYHDARIIFDMREVADVDEDDHLEFMFLHELVHVYTSGLQPAEPTKEWTKLDEHTACEIARAFQRIHRQLTETDASSSQADEQQRPQAGQEVQCSNS